MNGDQQRKALGYSLIFLGNEIEALKKTISTTTDILAKPHLERRLKELEVDFEMFQELEI